MQDIRQKASRAWAWGAEDAREEAECVWIPANLPEDTTAATLVQWAQALCDEDPEFTDKVPDPSLGSRARSEQALQESLGLAWNMAGDPKPGTQRHAVLEAYWHAWEEAMGSAIAANIRARAFGVATLVCDREDRELPGVIISHPAGEPGTVHVHWFVGVNDDRGIGLLEPWAGEVTPEMRTLQLQVAMAAGTVSG